MHKQVYQEHTEMFVDVKGVIKSCYFKKGR
jgi:hypothetical protein